MAHPLSAEEEATLQGEADLMDALATALMAHAAPGGAVDYPRAAAAFAQLLAEMIGPQPHKIQGQMITDFGENLKRLTLIASLRATANAGKAEVKQ